MHSNCSLISIRLVQSSLNGQIRVIIEHWRVGLTIFVKQMPSTKAKFGFRIIPNVLRKKRASDWVSVSRASRRSQTRVHG